MATSMSAASPNVVVFRDERTAHGRRGGLLAANANDPDEYLPAPEPGSPYRAAGLYEARGLAWPAVGGAVVLHATLALIALAFAWTSSPPSPLPESITVVFERAPAPAAEPAPQIQPPASASSEAQEPFPAEPPPAPAPAHSVASPPPAPATVAILPLPPPARPRPEKALAPAPEKPSVAPKEVASVAPAAGAPSPQPSAAAPVKVAALPVIPPRPASGMAGNRKPVYPVAARSRHLEGRVMLQVEVAASGDPLAVRVLSSSGHEMLDVAAVDAVRTWRFVPASQAGQAVAGSVDVPIDFRMLD